jgi:thiol-disulfide isomerase/thioredoxin
MMKRIRPIAALPIFFVLLFGLYACAPPSLGKAPEFNLQDVRGGSFNSSELKGKVVVVDFWATWCDPCIKEIPKYKELREKLTEKGVEILGITMESGSIDEVRPEVARLEIPYPVVMGTDAVADGFGGLIAFPTTFVVDRDGKIYKKYLGMTANKTEKIEKDIAALLGE